MDHPINCVSIKKEDLLSDDFLKQFKTGEDLYSFLGELDVHLGYEKYEKSTTSNARNGFSNKNVKTSFWESEIQVPLAGASVSLVSIYKSFLLKKMQCKDCSFIFSIFDLES